VQLSDADPNKPHILQEAVEKILAACCEKPLQPMLATEHLRVAHASKRLTTLEATVVTTTHTALPPVSNPRLTPIYDTKSFPVDLIESSPQWFDDLPNLAAE
jgi:hypothetical protein